MSTVIEDGTGKSYKAGVTEDNRLDVTAKSENRIYYVSRSAQKSFSVYGKRNFVAANTNENILYLKYDGNDNLYIKDIMFSSDSSDAKVEVYFDATSVSGGESVIPLNMNRSSAITSEVTALHGGTSLVGTVSSAKEMFDVRLNKSSFLMDFHSALILSKNTNVMILGEVASIGDKIRVMIYYYEE